MRRALQVGAVVVSLSWILPAHAERPSLSFGIVDVERVDLGGNGDLSLTLSASTSRLESELATAIEAYLRTSRPKLFGTIPLGVMRYRSGRLVPTKTRLWIDAADTRDNAVHYEIEADIVAERESLSVDCERDGWKLRCDRTWTSDGETVIANAAVTGSVVATARKDERLTKQPVHLKLFASSVSGSVLLGALGEVSLSVDVGETLIEEMDVGIPLSLSRRYPELDNWVLRSLRVRRSKKKTRIQLDVEVARTDELE